MLRSAFDPKSAENGRLVERSLLISQCCAGHPEFSVAFQHVLNEYRVANGSMTPEEKAVAEEAMRTHPVNAENALVVAQVLQAFLKRRHL